MCGVCGVFTHDRSIAEHAAALPRMIHLMRRRGPDDEGLWTDGQNVAFGFRRLSIIDLSPAGHQPMLSPCGRYVIVFNGELYNFNELRGQLESKGVNFQSKADTEVVLQALAVWGPEALKRFNGMFALAWFDIRTRTLLLARDPMGIKPLYYLLDNRGLVFGSQYDQLMCHPFCDRSKIRMDVLGLYLRLSYLPAPYGLIANTYQLEPGQYLRISPGSEPVIKSFYKFPEAQESYLTGKPAERETEQAILSAVKRQMVSDVPLGSFLSGGVDSPLVTAAMQRGLGKPLPAFTIGSTDPHFDESDVASTYAQQIGVKHYLRKFNEQDCLALLDQVAEAYSEPFADLSAFPSILLSSIARQQVKVALSGDGGDELFWGYPRFLKVLKARKYFQYPNLARFGLYAATKYLPFTRPPRGILFENIGNWYFDAHSGLRSSDLNSICPTARPYAEDFKLYELDDVPDAEELAQWLRLNELNGHLQMVLLKMDRASMYHGLEVRVPLLDLEVVACAARVHPADCMSDGVGKMILRKVLSRFVPEETIPLRKSGFDVPLGNWLCKELRGYVEDLLLTGNTFPAGLFRQNELKHLYRAHVNGTVDRTRGLWNLLSLQLWAQTHLKQQSPSLFLTEPIAQQLNHQLAAARV